MIIIGITGPAGSGKDTTASIIAKEFTCDIIRLSAPIKEMLAVLMQVDDDCYEDSDFKESYWNGKTVRNLLQTLGTEWGRDLVDENVWIDIAIAKALKSKAELVIIPDVRFDNEVLAIQSLGGVVFGISCNHASDFVEMHESEKTPYHLCDGHIDNCEDLLYLEKEIHETVFPYLT